MATSPNYTREDQLDVRVTLDGTAYGQSWDSLSGMGGDSNIVKIRVNGKEINIGGPGTEADVTIGIQFSDIVAGWYTIFNQRKGKGAIKFSWSILDSDLNVVASGSKTGMLKTCTFPDMNKNNTTPAASTFLIVVSVDE